MREGYVVVADLVPHAAIDRVMEEAKKVSVRDGGGWTPKVFDPLRPEQDAALHRLLVEPRITDTVEQIFEAGDGVSGLDTVRTIVPHLVLLDWDMPGMSGREFVKKVRSPESFPQPDVPIIILTGHREKSCIVDAERLGINAYLVKPVSGEQLLSCILSVVAKPRPFVRIGDYYGPESREAALGQ